MTKLLHVSDFHANQRWFNWTLDHAEEYDLIAYTGDFLDLYGPESVGTQVRWITAWAELLTTPFLWCPGNNDVETSVAPAAHGRWLARLPGAKAYGDSGHLECRGLSFVRVNWRGAVPQLRGGDIILAHAPPAGRDTATTKDGPDRGNLDLADALWSATASPWLVLSGHIHNPARWRDRCGGTISLNPGVTMGTRVPNHIVIDTAVRKATWFRDGELADVANL